MSTKCLHPGRRDTLLPAKFCPACKVYSVSFVEPPSITTSGDIAKRDESKTTWAPPPSNDPTWRALLTTMRLAEVAVGRNLDVEMHEALRLRLFDFAKGIESSAREAATAAKESER